MSPTSNGSCALHDMEDCSEMHHNQTLKITGELTVFLAAAMDEDFLHLFRSVYATAMYYFIMSFPIIYEP